MWRGLRFLSNADYVVLPSGIGIVLGQNDLGCTLLYFGMKVSESIPVKVIGCLGTGHEWKQNIQQPSLKTTGRTDNSDKSGIHQPHSNRTSTHQSRTPEFSTIYRVRVETAPSMCSFSTVNITAMARNLTQTSVSRITLHLVWQWRILKYTHWQLTDLQALVMEFPNFPSFPSTESHWVSQLQRDLFSSSLGSIIIYTSTWSLEARWENGFTGVAGGQESASRWSFCLRHGGWSWKRLHKFASQSLINLLFWT